MVKTKLFFITLHLVTIAAAQTDIKDFVNKSAVPISSIQPDSVNYADLDFIGQAIGNAKIVMLGEQDHGDAPTFLAKTRLIKYLHEKMGFNVLAFESDFFGLNFGMDRLEKKTAAIDSFIKKNIFYIWTYCNTCQYLLYNYIPATYQTENPLQLTGFDNQLILNYSSKHLISYLDSLLATLAIPVTKQQNYTTEILPLIDSLKYYSFKDTTSYSRCEGYLTQIKNEVAGKLDDRDFGMQIINSLLAENKEFQLNKTDNIIAGNTRDAQMAANLNWLTEVKFPTEKIIVWAANAHVAKYIDSSGTKGRKMISMGSFFTRNVRHLKETYVIGFTSYKGTAGRLRFKTYAVRKPQPNGFENWIDKAYNYSFVDFTTYHTKHPDESEVFFLKGLGHNSAFERDWTKVFDGIFFIRDMYPCER